MALDAYIAQNVVSLCSTTMFWLPHYIHFFSQNNLSIAAKVRMPKNQIILCIYYIHGLIYG